MEPQLPNLSFFKYGGKAAFNAFMAAIALSWTQIAYKLCGSPKAKSHREGGFCS
jgi:hypothetical protein